MNGFISYNKKGLFCSICNYAKTFHWAYKIHNLEAFS